MLDAITLELLNCLEQILSKAKLVPCKNGGEDSDTGSGMGMGKWRVESSIDGWIASAREITSRARGEQEQ